MMAKNRIGPQGHGPIIKPGTGSIDKRQGQAAPDASTAQKPDADSSAVADPDARMAKAAEAGAPAELEDFPDFDAIATAIASKPGTDAAAAGAPFGDELVAKLKKLQELHEVVLTKGAEGPEAQSGAVQELRKAVEPFYLDAAANSGTQATAKNLERAKFDIEAGRPIADVWAEVVSNRTPNQDIRKAEVALLVALRDGNGDMQTQTKMLQNLYEQYDLQNKRYAMLQFLQGPR